VDVVAIGIAIVASVCAATLAVLLVKERNRDRTFRGEISARLRRLSADLPVNADAVPREQAEPEPARPEPTSTGTAPSDQASAEVGDRSAYRQLDALIDASERNSADVTLLKSAVASMNVAIMVRSVRGETAFSQYNLANALSITDEALITGHMNDLIALAETGERGTRTIELTGPSPTTIQVTAWPIVSGEGPIGSACLAEDVSATQRAERVRTDFVANVSHELRTPVAAAVVLADALVVADESERPHLVSRVQHELVRLASLVEDLLDLHAAVQTSASRFKVVTVDQLINRVARRVQLTLEQRSQDLVLKIDPDLRIFGDKGQIQTALVNLLENASNYSDPGSSIVASARLVGDEVMISVTDSGIGIPQNDVERVFERFYRVDRGRSRLTGGTGLGLSIVRNVVEGHGGRVAIHSIEGRGTTVAISFPLADADPVPSCKSKTADEKEQG
jgi:two-component system sensor histidine kinase SenX3